MGYERTTSRDIASDAGANVSLLYRYFGSKEELFEVVLKESADLLEDLRGSSLADLIDHFVTGLEPGAFREYGHEHPLTMLLRDLGDDERARQLREHTLGTFISYTAELMAERSEPANARIRAGLLLSALVGVVTLRAAIPDDPFGRAGPADLSTELHWIAGVLAAGDVP
jgi:AcrR family transcriptional regulator